MAVAIDPNTRELYVLREDRLAPPGAQTTFLLRPVTAGEFSALTAAAGREVFAHELAFAGLVGWENLRDTEGADVPYSAAAARTRLCVRWLLELGAVVARLSRLTEDDVGNSGSPPLSSSAACPTNARTSPVGASV